VLLRQLFDSTLNLKVHRAGGGSNKALSRRVDDVGAETGDCLLDGVSRHPVAFAQYRDFLSLNIHSFSFWLFLPG
jgi:hypothetical protein